MRPVRRTPPPRQYWRRHLRNELSGNRLQTIPTSSIIPHMKLEKVEVAVLGAGLAGAGVALELAARGIQATLVERDELAMNRASLRNEGKIHLGLIYANDTTGRTARLQLSGALRFSSVLRRWLGDRVDELTVSSPFIYVIAIDSVASVEHIESHYAAVQSMYEQAIRDDGSLDYLGRRPQKLVRRCEQATFARFFTTRLFSAAFQTEEVAIDPAELAPLVRSALAGNCNIRFLPRHNVVSVQRVPDGFRIEGSGVDGAWELHAAQVVNALWEERIVIDHSVGIEPLPGWVHRLKYRVIAKLPPTLHGAPSATMVLGPYGDIVVRSNGSAYLSWYPGGMRGWSKSIAPPRAWERFCRGELTEAERANVVQSIVPALDAWFPTIGSAFPILVDAGVIVAYGDTDVHDRHSALHDRTRIGVASVDGYHSVDPGKLTTAPIFALLAAERVAASIGRRAR